MIFGHDDAFYQACNGTWTAREIAQQPTTWKKTINQINEMKGELKSFIDPLLADENLEIIFTGAGTSEFVGNALFSFINTCTGFRAKSYASTDLVQTPAQYLNPNHKTLLVSFGRSGNSPESVGAVQVVDVVCKENAYHLFITCNNEGALAKAVATHPHALAINLTPETHDKSFAMTSSFSNMMLAAMLCFNLDRLPEVEAQLEDAITAGQRFIDEGYVAADKIVKEIRLQPYCLPWRKRIKRYCTRISLKTLRINSRSRRYSIRFTTWFPSRTKICNQRYNINNCLHF